MAKWRSMGLWHRAMGHGSVGLATAGLFAALGCNEDPSAAGPDSAGAAGQTALAGQGGAGAGVAGRQGNEGGSTAGQAASEGGRAGDGGRAGGVAGSVAGSAGVDAGAGGVAGAAPGSSRITFEDLALAADSYWNGSDGSGAFESGFGVFANQYDPEYLSWGGFSYSNTTDTLTADFANQFSSASGAGAAGSATYAVAYRGAERPRVSFPDAGDGVVISGAFFGNTTYTALTLRDGGAFSEPLGGADGSDPDWFLVEAYGVTDGGALTGPVRVYLADFRSEDPALDTIETGWRWVSLTELGPVVGLEFELSSSDTGEYGMNTPAYFALDALTRE